MAAWKLGMADAASAAPKMAAYRRRLRARGLRPLQVWVADLKDAAVRARLAADARRVRGHPSTAEGDAFADAALAEVEGWKG